MLKTRHLKDPKPTNVSKSVFTLNFHKENSEIILLNRNKIKFKDPNLLPTKLCHEVLPVRRM